MQKKISRPHLGDGSHLEELLWSTRRIALEGLANSFPEHVRISELLPDAVPIPQFVQVLEEYELEGIVLKCEDSLYREGKGTHEHGQAPPL